MAASLSVDLRWRVVRAINEEGLSIRAAGRRFCIGESTAGRWHRLWRTSGDIVPGRKGNPGGSRLDAHAGFLLGLVEAGGKDITLAEMAERLRTERSEAVDPSTIHNWLKKRGITFKKRQAMLPNRLAKTSLRPAKPGSTASAISTPKN